jgi:hypothetical protein
MQDDGLDVNVVRPDQRWIEIEDLLGPPVGKPFVSPGAEHSPYGGRQFKAYHDVIFEVCHGAEKACPAETDSFVLGYGERLRVKSHSF